jgi:hypothetical protein
MVKCEPLSYEAQGNNRNKFEYKIQYNYDNEEAPCGIAESFLNFPQKPVETIIEHEENDENFYK